MSIMRGTLFNGERLSNEFENRKLCILRSINSESDNYILNVSEEEYITHLLSVNSFDKPIILISETYAEAKEENILIEKFPNSYLYANRPDYIKKQVIRYNIPCEGDISLMRYRPNTIILSMANEVEVIGHNLVIDIIDFDNDVNKIRSQFSSVIQRVQQMCEYLVSDIESYNKSLLEFTKTEFKNRKQTILDNHNVLSALGIPIKKATDTPYTFAIPRPQNRKIIITKPVVVESKYIPEPTLDLVNYNEILKIINDVGKNFERLPSVYKSKNEEDLRDHILLVLDPNFSMGGASGETFNKNGKTDILIRYDSSVVFIAECKFWKGEKVFLKTIDQLFSYLTWRDSKAAIIFFVTQKNLSEIISTVKTSIEHHNNYLGYIDSPSETWHNYRFHTNGDRNREVRLAIQLFHIPTL